MKVQVLLIDDDEDLMDSLQVYLKLKGYSVITANTAQIGIDLYSKNDPCIVFMDIKMPVMDGYEAFSIIKKAHSNAKVILVTGHEIIKKSKDAMNNGLLGILKKPVEPEEIVKTIQKNDC